jgi:hypothetical protein
MYVYNTKKLIVSLEIYVTLPKEILNLNSSLGKSVI